MRFKSKKNIGYAAILILLLLFFSYFFLKNIWTKENKIEFVFQEKSALEKLSLEEKIGQIFIIGIEGTSLGPKTADLIKELHPGGILLLGKNIKDLNQVKKLIASLQKIAIEDIGLPLFIAVDQEGGVISRIKWAEKTPQQEIKNAERAYEIGEKRGEDLKEMGINLNLAPLLDYGLAKDFIFERTFKDINSAGDFAKNLILGQKEAGILSAIKHFPGYGAISFNPEDKLAKVEKVPPILQFKEAIEASPDFVMISNVIYKDFNNKLPFTFLPEAITFLKKELKGDYIVISDDLSQYSFLNNFSLKDIVSLPLNFGVEVLIFSGFRLAPEKGITALRESVKENNVKIETINQAVLKIIKLKEELLKNNVY